MIETALSLIPRCWQKELVASINKMPLIDVLAESSTGSGKSFGYLLALRERYRYNKIPDRLLLNDNRKLSFSASSLIMVPHLNLGHQIQEWARSLMPGFTINLITEQGSKWICENSPQILISTPNYSDFLKNVCFETIILDEVDDMMKTLSRYAPTYKRNKWSRHPPPIYALMDTWTQNKQLMRKLPQVVALSATLNHSTRREMEVRHWISKDAICLKEDQNVLDRMKHIFYESLEVDLKRIMLEIQKYSPRKVLLVVDQETSELRVASELRRLHWNAISWSDLCLAVEKRKSLDEKSKSFPIVVCQTKNCRGMDDRDISHVVIICPVDSPTTYEHIAGRTARQGNEGTVISFFHPTKAQELIRYLKLKRAMCYTWT